MFFKTSSALQFLFFLKYLHTRLELNEHQAFNHFFCQEYDWYFRKLQHRLEMDMSLADLLIKPVQALTRNHYHLHLSPKSDHCLALSLRHCSCWILLKLLDLSKLRDVEKNPNVPTLTLSDGGVLRSYTWQRSGGLNQSKIYTRRILHLWPQFFSHTNTLIQGDQMKLSILIFAFLKLNVWNTRHKKMMMMVAAVVGKNVYRGVTWLSRDSTGRGR